MRYRLGGDLGLADSNGIPHRRCSPSADVAHLPAPHPGHVRVIAERIRPILAWPLGLQYEIATLDDWAPLPLVLPADRFGTTS